MLLMLGFCVLLLGFSLYAAITTHNAIGKFLAVAFAVVSAVGAGALGWDLWSHRTHRTKRVY